LHFKCQNPRLGFNVCEGALLLGVIGNGLKIAPSITPELLECLMGLIHPICPNGRIGQPEVPCSRHDAVEGGDFTSQACWHGF
jgi:hypothetical protein